MKYVIVGKNMEVSPSLEKSVKDKLGKLEKFFAEDTTPLRMSLLKSITGGISWR